MIRDELSRALARAARAVLPGHELPGSLPLNRGRTDSHGDWVCSWCLKAAREAGMEAAVLAWRIAEVMPQMPQVARVTVQGGFLNVYLADHWYLQTMEAYKSILLQPFAVPQTPGDAHRRFGMLWSGVRPLVKGDSLWYLHRDRSNPLYSIRYAAQRSAQLAARTAMCDVLLTPSMWRHIRNLEDCVAAAQAQDASALCAALYATSGSFRVVYEEQKPGFRAKTLAAATSNVLRQGLQILNLAE